MLPMPQTYAFNLSLPNGPETTEVIYRSQAKQATAGCHCRGRLQGTDPGAGKGIGAGIVRTRPDRRCPDRDRQNGYLSAPLASQTQLSAGKRRTCPGACSNPGTGNPNRGTYPDAGKKYRIRSEAHTSELQSLMRISYAVFCLKK